MTAPQGVVSAIDFTNAPDGTAILHAFAKRTYNFGPGFPPIPAPLQEPLQGDPTHYPPTGQGTDTAPRTDPDVFCHKKFGTDVVIQGAAYAAQGPVSVMDVGVGITVGSMAAEKSVRRVRVMGNRRVEARGNGNDVAFTPPEPFERMPLTYDRAYGGCDLWSAAEHPDKVGQWLAKHSNFSAKDLSLYRYPRNPAGRGFLVYPSRAAFDALLLPNIELPDDLLTPSRLCTDHLYRWPSAPFPAGFDWFDPTWFPRVSFFLAACPPHKCAAEDFCEVRRGMLPKDIVHSQSNGATKVAAGFQQRFYHGASPWLTVPVLRGQETIVLWGMHPKAPRLEVPLPLETPQVLFELPNGRVFESEASLRTVVVRPDDGILVTVWSAQKAIGQLLTEPQALRLRHAVRWRTGHMING